MVENGSGASQPSATGAALPEAQSPSARTFAVVNDNDKQGRLVPCHSIKNRRCTCSDGEACTKPGKHPRIAKWDEYASSDPAQQKDWIDTWGDDLNWGLLLGDDHLAVDVDGHVGAGSLAAWETENGALPITRTNITPNGLHLLFRKPADVPIRNAVGWLPGVDIRSGDGYIIIPPARHISGKQYAWRDESVAVADAPQVLLDALLNRPAAATTSAPGERISTGTRNATLYQHAADNYLLTGNVLGTRALIYIENRELCDEPLENAEVEKILTSAFNRDPITTGSVMWARNPLSGVAHRRQQGGAFILDEPDVIEANWGLGEDVLWAKGEGLMLVGHQGVGKTTLGQQLVLHRIGVRVGPFLGYIVAPSVKPVLYLAMDRPRQAARSMRRMVNEPQREQLDSRLVVWRGPLPINVLSGTSAFADWVQEMCPECGDVVVDSVKDLAPGLSADEVGAGLNSSWQELIAREVELLLLHHERKAGNAASRIHSLDDVYGSTWLTSGLGSVFVIDGEPGDPTVELRHLKQPANPVGPLTVRHDHMTGTTTRHDGVHDLKSVLATATGDGFTKQELSRIVIGRVTNADVKKIERDLHRLRDLVTRTPGVMSPGGRTPDRFRLAVGANWAAGL